MVDPTTMLDMDENARPPPLRVGVTTDLKIVLVIVRIMGILTSIFGITMELVMVVLSNQ